MTSRIFYGGGWRIATGRKKRIGGAWRTATRSKVYKGGSWLDAASYIGALSAVADIDPVRGSAHTGYPRIVETALVTITPTGGLAPYTYSWSSGITSATTPTAASTTFQAFLNVEYFIIESATCTVTDAAGSTASASVTVSLANRDSPGGGFDLS